MEFFAKNKAFHFKQDLFFFEYVPQFISRFSFHVHTEKQWKGVEPSQAPGSVTTREGEPLTHPGVRLEIYTLSTETLQQNRITIQIGHRLLQNKHCEGELQHFESFYNVLLPSFHFKYQHEGACES
jgi:hypothetical protein